MDDRTQQWIERIRSAAASGQALRWRGGGSKDFYGQALAGEILDTRGHCGIIAYEPSELVITARSGTSLKEIEAALAAAGQMLGFEPPHFGKESNNATLGGCIAAGLSGPRRASAGAVRDFVLGLRLIDGVGRMLNFGGQVMKNVAGFDVSRLMAGSLGTLGLFLDISLKVLPKPRSELSLRFEMPQHKAIETLNRWAGKPLPISASCWVADELVVRLSGARAAVDAARQQLGGETLDAEAGAACWMAWREQQTDFFAGELPLWRLSVPSVAPPLDLHGEQLIEWGGSLRWLSSGAAAESIRNAAAQAGGHATLFRASEDLKQEAGVFHPLPHHMLALQRRIKHCFDPHGLFNPGRMYL
ncbi:MAG: glycolate oxidase subunit GlcE [Sterolibacterium sp.]